MYSGIYKITHKMSGKSYIGKAKNITQRWRDEINQHHKRALCYALDKYGADAFDFEVIEEIDLQNYDILANEREKYWIEYYDTYNNGYNETLGGDGGRPKGILPKNTKLTSNDVINIRLEYQKGEKARSEVYQLYKNKISQSGFEKVWHGITWKNIMPEIYDNKRQHIKPKNKQ